MKVIIQKYSIGTAHPYPSVQASFLLYLLGKSEKDPKRQGQQIRTQGLQKHIDPPQLIVNFTQQVWCENLILSALKMENFALPENVFQGEGGGHEMEWKHEMVPLNTAMTLERFFFPSLVLQPLVFKEQTCCHLQRSHLYRCSSLLSLQGLSLFRL